MDRDEGDPRRARGFAMERCTGRREDTADGDFSGIGCKERRGEERYGTLISSMNMNLILRRDILLFPSSLPRLVSIFRAQTIPEHRPQGIKLRYCKHSCTSSPTVYLALYHIQARLTCAKKCTFDVPRACRNPERRCIESGRQSGSIHTAWSQGRTTAVPHMDVLYIMNCSRRREEWTIVAGCAIVLFLCPAAAAAAARRVPLMLWISTVQSLNPYIHSYIL